MKSPIRVLIYGRFAPQNFEFCWLEWLNENGYTARAFDHHAVLNTYAPYNELRRILWRFFQPTLISIVSRQFVKVAIDFKPELIIVVSGHLISSSALQKIRQRTRSALVHFYGEDFFNPFNTNRNLQGSIRLYDHLFTTKSFNVPELAVIGLDRVTYVPHGYRPNCHFPIEVGQSELKEYGADVSFVGTWEGERAGVLEKLTDLDLKIWGNEWSHLNRSSHLRSFVQHRSVYCDEMSKVFNASKINLAFLRKANRDRHTSRTFEIPACGGFQLSERTEEVLDFFDEGREIECFASVDELKDKSRYYLKNESQRQNIARAGLARVKNSPYSYTDRLQTILQHYSYLKI